MKYFDNCATSKIDDEVLEEMMEFQRKYFYNPSSLYKISAEITNKINRSRESIAKIIGASANEIYFTSGGTESNNLALFGTMRGRKGRIITSMAEHASVYNPINELKNRGFEVVYAPLNPDGSVNVEKFANLADNSVALVALMHVNNETGAINDIKSLSSIAKEKNSNCIFFCDGVQSFCKIPVNVKNLGVDMYSMSAHKIHGPKGVGALYVAKNISINPILFGGGQEYKLRSGTENTAGIVGFAKAANKAFDLIEENIAKYVEFNDILNNIITDKVSDFKKLSDNSVKNMCTLAFKHIKSEVILHMLEADDIFVGNGSACSSKAPYSRIATAINLPKEYAEGIIRICFCKYNTQSEVEELGDKLCKSVNQLRKLMGVK